MRYMECLKNHAASFGGNATDGCGQFIPSGQDASINDSLTCSACHCHRNFHRKLETICIHHHPFTSFHNQHHYFNTNNPLMHLSDHPTHYHHHHYNHNSNSSMNIDAAPPHHQIIMSYNMGMAAGSLLSESDHHSKKDQQEHLHQYHKTSSNNNNNHQPVGGVKKRHRTKFSQDHKDKMLAFAERVGWKLQKQEDSLVQQFCNEIGVKRRVLKVWMHNNKHTYYHHSTTPPPPPPPAT
ncbi:Zinc-finger homeodomain protein 3 [Linum perenne]